MDHLGLNIFKYGRKSCLVVADTASGYCWCKYLGKRTTSREVSDRVRMLFLKLGIMYMVWMDIGPKL